MSDNVEETQEDPRLKEAVKRCWLSERAPLDLRHKITQLISADGSVDALSARRQAELIKANRRRRLNLWGLAVAACLFVGFGIFFAHPKSTDVAMPDYVAQAFIHTHDGCCMSKDHHHVPGVGPDDFAAIGKKLSSDLSTPVISVPVDGWQFAGAGACPVYGHTSAHMLYRKGQDTLSIFSIPLSSISMTPGEGDFARSVDHHNLSSFAKGNAMYCVVECSPDGSLKPADARLLRDHLRDTFTTACVSADGCRQTVASR